MKHFIIFLLCIFLSIVATSQHKFGFTASLFDRSYSGYGIIDNWQAESRTYANPGMEVGLFYHYDISRWFYAKSELRYLFDDQTFIVLTNNQRRLSNGIGHRRIELPINLGFQMPVRKVKFRLFSYLSPSLFVTRKPDDFYTWDDFDKSFFEGYSRFNLNNGYGFGIDYWRLSLDLYREDALFPLIKSVHYNGNDYPFRLDASRLFFTLGFKIIDK